MCTIKNYNSATPLTYLLYKLVLLSGFIIYGDSKNSNVCGGYVVSPRGKIHSPNYPFQYPSNVSCSWTILSPPNTILTLVVQVVDIEEDVGCNSSPCCLHNWLSLPIDNEDNYKKICGRNFKIKPIHILKNHTVIKFFSSDTNSSHSGFLLSYFFTDAHAISACQPNEFRCGDGKCLPGTIRCDKVAQCDDQTDEVGCQGLCGPGQAFCGLRTAHCFSPFTEKCDNITQCPFGEDEVGCVIGCESGISCDGGDGCYSIMNRCDSHPDCFDGSDEMNCSENLCLEDSRLCTNAKCVHHSLWCDGHNDCDDNSDEENCIRNSVISATIMGCLLCGLLLVLAVLCTLRVYTKRTMTNVNCGFQLPPHIAARLNMTHSISLPALIDDEYFHREPPPAYSVAVRQSDTTIPVPAHASHSGRRQRSRRHHPRPMIKPPTPPPSSETSNQSSPSRDSITSSSYLSNDDNARLIDT